MKRYRLMDYKFKDCKIICPKKQVFTHLGMLEGWFWQIYFSCLR